jgi:hypothetical protein
MPAQHRGLFAVCLRVVAEAVKPAALCRAPNLEAVVVVRFVALFGLRLSD